MNGQVGLRVVKWVRTGMLRVVKAITGVVKRV